MGLVDLQAVHGGRLAESVYKLIRDVLPVARRSYLALDPSLAKCDVKGIARKRKGIAHSKFNRFETPEGKPVYSFEHVQLEDKLSIPGIAIRNDALGWPIPDNGMGFRRKYTRQLALMDKPEAPDTIPSNFIAKLKRSQTIT